MDSIFCRHGTTFGHKTTGELRVELYIDNGHAKQTLAALERERKTRSRPSCGERVPEALTWYRKEDVRAVQSSTCGNPARCSIAMIGPEHREWLRTRLEAFDAVFRPIARPDLRRADSRGSQQPSRPNGATVGFEEKLWAAADKMRGHLDPAEYKHVALGLIFLKYISDSFEELHQRLIAQVEAEWQETAQEAAAHGQDPDKLRDTWTAATDPEDRDEYTAENVFWVPPAARWSYLQDNAKQPTIGKLLDDAMDAVERDNPSLRGVLPKRYAREDLDKRRLGELIDLIGTISMGDSRVEVKGRARARVRVLPRPLRQRRGQGRRRVLHGALRGQAAGRDDRAPARARLRPLLRLGRHVRAERALRRGTRRRQGRHLALRTGEQPDHLAPRQDEPRHPRPRRRPGAAAGRHVPQRPAQGPEGRLHPRQPAVQRERLGRRPPARRRALEVRRAAGRQRQLRLGAAQDPPPGAAGRGRLRARQRLDELAAERRGRDPQGRSSRPTWSTA